jgi:hypothetical protein
LYAFLLKQKLLLLRHTLLPLVQASLAAAVLGTQTPRLQLVYSGQE